MQPQVRHGVLLAVFGGIVGLATARCSSSHEGGASKATISGQVLDENEAPLSQAVIAVNGSSMQIATDAQGKFSFTPPQDTRDGVTMQFQAAGFAKQYRLYNWKNESIDLAQVRLRRVDKSMDIALPTAAGQMATVDAMRGSGGAKVTVGYQALVLPNGQPADGNATIEMTYWHPMGSYDSLPAALVARVGTENVSLRTFGMLSVEASQNGQPLQVAPGATATLTFVMPEEIRSELVEGSYPSLYWLDPNIGMWTDKTDVGQGKLEYNPQTYEFVAHVPHLSEWNMDGSFVFSNGGCISGHVVNACNPTQGANNTEVDVWFLGVEQLKKWIARTDASGNYCVNIGVGDFQGFPDDPRGYTVSYMLTGSNIRDLSTSCNPLPPQCQSCLPEYATWDFPPCNNCRLQKPGVTPYTPPGDTTVRPNYSDCSPKAPLAYVNPCHFCPGTAPSQCTKAGFASTAISGGCYNLQTITMKPPGCVCQDRNATCGGPGGAKCCPGSDGSASACNNLGICVPCKHHTPGEACGPEEGCCDPTGTLDLVCQDSVCVQRAEPAYSDQ